MATACKQSLVKCIKTIANPHLVLSLRSLRSPLRGYYPVDHGRTLRFSRSGTAQVLHNTAITLDTTHYIFGTGSEPATAPGLLAQLFAGIQRTHAGGHPSLLANRRFWRRDSCLDSCRLLVLFVHSWRPRRSRRPRRRS
jgi:hypothetical protein